MKLEKKANRALTLGILLTLLSVSVHASIPKRLSVPKISCPPTLQANEVPALLDACHIDYDSINVVNWKDFPYCPKVGFRIAHTGNTILIHYRIEENSVRAQTQQDNGNVYEDSCVEFFIAPNSDSIYYNFECNCVGMLLVEEGKNGMERRKANTEIVSSVKRWSSLGRKPFPEQIGMHKWEIALIIPSSAFFKHTVHSLDGQTMKGNFYKCGDKLRVPHYLSWSPIQVPCPAFHHPDFFGIIKFK